MGDIEVWDRAEATLENALNEFREDAGIEWELNPGDGAFYGPKIDITIMDSLRREWQTATIQLDFQLPQNFGLEYMTSEMVVKAKDDSEEESKPKQEEPKKEPKVAPVDGAEVKKERFIKPLTSGCARPVMIHRAIAGSIERFTGILIEHFGGKWPFWLSPRQILVIPVGKGFQDYANEVRNIFHQEQMFVDVDLSGETLPKKIRSGQLAQYNFIFGTFSLPMLSRWRLSVLQWLEIKK
jgi:threonyl-tRNA synthetase